MSNKTEYLEIFREITRFSKKTLQEAALDWDLNPAPQNMTGFWKKCFSMDLPLLSIPEEFNGAGYGSACQALAVDALASQCPGAASVFAHHYAGLFPVQFGDTKLQSRLFKSIGDNKGRGVVGIIFDHDQAISWTRNGKHLFINGVSALTGNAQYADWMTLFIKEREQGATCLTVDLDNPGISLGPNPELPGLKSNPFQAIHFNNAAVLPQAMIGQPGQSESLMNQTKDLFYILTAAMAVGAARSAYEKALAYARDRYQFGKVIINHQEIRRMLGAMQMKLGAANACLYDYFVESQDLISRTDRKASLVKAFCTDAAFDIVVDAIQIHGGYGYMHEQGLEKLMRDVKVLQVLGGSNPQLMVEAVV